MAQLFVVEYCNAHNQAFNKTVATSNQQKVSDLQLQNQVLSDFSAEGFRVFAIWEILGGLTFEQHEKITEANPDEGLKTMRMIYYDRLLEQTAF